MADMNFRWKKGNKLTRVGVVQLESLINMQWSIAKCLALIEKMIEKASIEKCDVICIPEGAMVLGLKNWREAAKPIPGQVSGILSKLDKRANMYIIGWQLEIDVKKSVSLARELKANTFRLGCIGKYSYYPKITLSILNEYEALIMKYTN